MNHIKYFTIACSIFISVGCGSGRIYNLKNNITVSILPLKYLVDSISGGDFDVNVVVPPGSSPETYEPTPSQMKSIAKSKIYFELGLIDFEKPISEGFLTAMPSLEIINLSDNMSAIPPTPHYHDDKSHGTDPHVWLSPRYMKEIAAIIGAKLIKINPDSSEKYSYNLTKLSESINSIDLHIKQSFNNLRTKEFLIYHPFLTYYARDYALEQLSVENEGKEPSAEYLKLLINKIKADKLTTIFYQKQSDESVVEALVKEAKLKKEIIDPLAYDWKANIMNITSLLKESME